MNIHPLLYDLLRSIEMESPQYPGKNLLWCGMDAATGMAQVAGIVPLGITLISIHDLYLKSAWSSMQSRRFDEIYQLFKQVHPATPPLHRASRIPPKIVPDDPTPWPVDRAAKIQYEGSAQEEMDRARDEWHDEKSPRMTAQELDEATTRKRYEDSQPRPPMTDEEAWHGLTGE